MTIITHLWQSTLCLALAAVVATALRHGPARSRHAVWLLASIKFLVPFPALVTLGTALGAWTPALAAPRAAVAIRWFDQPIPFWSLAVEGGSGGAGGGAPIWPLPLTVVWLAGMAGFAWWRWRTWRQLVLAARAARPLDEGREADVLRRLVGGGPSRRPTLLLASAPAGGPGVFGVLRPRLLWPSGLSDRFTDDELEAVVAHELVHVRRGDNVAILLQIVVETVFWFYPMVWWLGTRLTTERERACDEEVVRMGIGKRHYAEGLLKACGFSLRAPNACAAPAGGSNLAQRIERIMECEPSPPLATLPRVLLGCVAAAVTAAPLMAGVLDPQPATAQAGASCAITSPVAERPPDDPHSPTSAGFAGTPGPWHANRDRSMWAWGGTPAPGTLHTKILWVRPAGAPLRIAVERLDARGVEARVDIPAGYPWTYQASAIDFPSAGCFAITGTSAGRTLRFVVTVSDPLIAAPVSVSAGPQPGVDARGATAPFRVGPGVVSPKLLREVKPGYTPDAMSARIEGRVVLEAIVLPDGTVGDVTVTRSLDKVHGLDDEAVATVRKWQFAPGTREGVAVPVVVEIEMVFRLK